MKRLLSTVGLLAATVAACPTAADVGPPAHLQITEREPGLFTVRWRVPKALPARAVPTPALPESCRPAGDREVDDQTQVWLFARDWRCEAGIAGESVAMRYPFPEFALTTVVRVDLLSGDRFAHVLEPGETNWLLPDGTAPPDRLREARHAVLSAGVHALGSGVHIAFLCVLALLGGYRRPLVAVSLFSLGQLVGVTVSVGFRGIGAAAAEIGPAVAVVLLAREALRAPEERRRVPALAAAAGLVHGLGSAAWIAGAPGDEAVPLGARVLAVLGMDAAHLLGVLVAAFLWSSVARDRDRTRLGWGSAYVFGAVGFAMALGLVAAVPAEPTAAAERLPFVITADPNGDGGTRRSRRVAPAGSDAPLQSFLSVEPFEIRHEVMLRLSALNQEPALSAGAVLPTTTQPAVISRLANWVRDHTDARADGVTLEGNLRRADFMTVDSTGALPRTTPVDEPLDQAVVGVVITYPTSGMPKQVELRWEIDPESDSPIPATLIDPESVRTVRLTADDPTLVWTNALDEDPIPTVAAVPVEPARFSLPVLSLPLLALAAALLVVGIRRRRLACATIPVRVILAVAVVAAPLAQTAIALPGSAGRVPSERQARRILAGLLPNVYRAMEFRDESMIFDRLTISVTGATLTEVYLEQRRSLEMEERGGAQARVEAVEILEAGDVEAHGAGFDVRSRWTVSGTVTHFGHRHFRQNRYDARIGIVPVDGAWKIRSLEILEQDRIR